MVNRMGRSFGATMIQPTKHELRRDIGNFGRLCPKSGNAANDFSKRF